MKNTFSLDENEFVFCGESRSKFQPNGNIAQINEFNEAVFTLENFICEMKQIENIL